MQAESLTTDNRGVLAKLPGIAFKLIGVVVVAIGLGEAALVAAASAAPPESGSFGAYAVVEGTSKFGYSWDKKTQKEADDAALKGCASDKCKIVFRTKAKQCGALAFTADGKAWGGARRDKSDAAETAAKENCQKQTKDPKDQCEIRASRCNR
jgi:hypothetical protein